MTVEVRLPRLSVTMQQAKVVDWLVAQGDVVEKGQPLVAVEMDKATMEVEAPEDGVLSQILAPVESTVSVGDLLALIGTTEEAAERVPLATEPAHALRVKPAQARESGRRRISPVARRLIAEHGLDVDQIQGTGPGGAVVKDDVRRLLASREAEPSPLVPASSVGIPAREPAATTLPLRGIRQVMAQRMTSSRQTIVQATTVADVDMTEVVCLRRRIPASYTAFVIKAGAKAVAEYPLVNASLDKDTLVLKRHVHMGVAVATEEGLIVPVIREAENKSLAQIHSELEALSKCARERTLRAEKLAGPTMTVTNSGVFGSLLFTPIVVAPQSVTLGMGRVAQTPVVRDGQVVIRDVMYLCLSYDHRFIDGAIAVPYLQRIRAYLEDPLSLLWEGAGIGPNEE